MSALKDLRAHAIAAACFGEGTLRQTVERLGFVQADPIRSPAPAQDLILRHRVKDYRVGDLERQYSPLGLEEDRLYAHGFMPRAVCRLLHPRIQRRLTSIEQKVLEITVREKRVHPDDLAIHFGSKTVRNDWGGQSRATTRALQSLHFGGHLRVAGRENGNRFYAAAMVSDEDLEPTERFRRLLLVMVSLLGPISEKSLGSALGCLTYRAPGLRGIRSVVPKLVGTGELIRACVDGISYLSTAKRPAREAPNTTVRFLAPFDPVVWDRQRFEHLWGWPYRFEAYVPAAKRQFGYYAMPMLWQNDVVGWVNGAHESQRLVVERGFKKAIPQKPIFEREFEAEVARLEMFLKKRNSGVRGQNSECLGAS